MGLSCESCGEVKLSKEFHLGPLADCHHPAKACLKCLAAAHAASGALTCGRPGCDALVSREAAAAVQAEYANLCATGDVARPPATPPGHTAEAGAAGAAAGPRDGITVTMMGGQTLRLPLRLTMTVAELKGQLAEVFGLALNRQRLLLGTRELKMRSREGAPRTLADYGVVRGDRLSVLSIYSAAAGLNRIDAARLDAHGNAAGTEYDLGVDGAFMGLKVCVLKLYNGDKDDFTFAEPRGVLEQKGFEVQLWTCDELPAPQALAAALQTACQLWILSTVRTLLSAEHRAAISEFFQNGGGLYLFGDNEPFFMDANALSEPLLDARLKGNEMGCKMLKPHVPGKPNVQCLVGGHLITTGIVNLLEGNTISWLVGGGVDKLEPLCYSSGGNLLSAAYDREGRRAVIDGGYTRLFGDYWTTAGTARFVVNAAVWLANLENNDREM